MKQVIVGIVALAFVATSFGQGSGDLSGKNVLIIKAGPVTVKNPRKMERKPVIFDTTKIEPNLKYSFLQKQYDTPYDPEVIPAARIKRDKIAKLYPGYIKLGVTSQATPLAEIYYTSKRDKKNMWGVYGKHFSWNGINANNFSGYGDNELKVFGSKLLLKHKLEGDLRYRHDFLHRYGFDTAFTAIDVNKDFVKQRFNILDLNGRLTSMYKDTSKFNHIVNVNYRFMDDIEGVNEHYFKASGDINRRYGKELFGLNTSLDVNSYAFGGANTTNSIFELRPNISTISDKWRLRVGLNLTANTTTSVNFHFYPELDFNFNIIDNVIIPYGGVTGKMQRVNFYELTRQNPFVSSSLPMANMNNKYKVYGGLRGSITNELTYNLHAERNRFASMPLFVKDFRAVPSNTFTLEYDTVKNWEFGAQMAYQELEKLKIIVDGRYYVWEALNAARVWHKPDYRFSIMANYDLKDKIIAKASVFVLGAQYAKPNLSGADGEPQEEKIKGMTDLNLGLEYRYTKRISAYIDLNNILSFKYYRWQHYPTQQFNVLGGITFSF